MSESNFQITMRRTINDPAERRLRLERLYSFFERINKNATDSTILADSEPAALSQSEQNSDIQYDTARYVQRQTGEVSDE